MVKKWWTMITVFSMLNWHVQLQQHGMMNKHVVQTDLDDASWASYKLLRWLRPSSNSSFSVLPCSEMTCCRKVTCCATDAASQGARRGWTSAEQASLLAEVLCHEWLPDQLEREVARSPTEVTALGWLNALAVDMKPVPEDSVTEPSTSLFLYRHVV